MRGYDQALWHTHDDGATWDEWNNDAGGLLLSSPAVVSTSGRLDVFAVGVDNRIYQNNWDGRTWNGWSQVDRGGSFLRLSVLFHHQKSLPRQWRRSAAANSICFAAARIIRCCGAIPMTASTGVRGKTWAACSPRNRAQWLTTVELTSLPAAWTMRCGTMTGTSSGAWQRVDRPGMPAGVTIASAPAVVSPAAGRILVTVRGSDGGLWQLAYDGSSWGNWNRVGPNKSTSGQAGQALGLDGVDDYVDLPDNLSNVTQFTFAAWVYWNGGQPWQRIFDFGRDTELEYVPDAE